MKARIAPAALVALVALVAAILPMGLLYHFHGAQSCAIHASHGDPQQADIPAIVGYMTGRYGTVPVRAGWLGLGAASFAIVLFGLQGPFVTAGKGIGYVIYGLLVAVWWVVRVVAIAACFAALPPSVKYLARSATCTCNGGCAKCSHGIAGMIVGGISIFLGIIFSCIQLFIEPGSVLGLSAGAVTAIAAVWLAVASFSILHYIGSKPWQDGKKDAGNAKEPAASSAPASSTPKS